MIFSKPITELNIEDIKIFCEKKVREGFSLDYKENFPRDLAKTICAFANTSGGVILIGIEEDKEGKPKLPIKGVPFEKGLSERIVNIILSNINPPLFPEIAVIKFKRANNDLAIIVIRIPQSNETPHAIDNKKFVYIRTDNRNKQEEVATIEQVQWLLNKRKKSEELKQFLYNDANERLTDIYESIERIGEREKTIILPNGLNVPKAQGILSSIPLFPNKPLINVQELKNLCSGNDLRIGDYFYELNDFPYFNQEPKTTQQSVISYFLKNRRRELFFYEFNVYGLFFYQQSFGWYFNEEEGGRKKGENTNSVWFHHILARLDQFLEIIDRFYDKIGIYGLIEIRLKFNDIFNLKMAGTGSFFNSRDNRISHQRNLEIKRILTKQKLKKERIDVLKNIFREICFAFNFNVEDKIIEDYLEKNKRGK